MNKKPLKKVLMISTLLVPLIACTEQSNSSSQQAEALQHANKVKHEIYTKYLNCYPLAPKDKKQCANKLANKYLQKYLSDAEYVRSFQYEAEKLGFKHFLTAQGLTCQSIKEGPEFDNSKQAYLVKCTDPINYHMQFDYDKQKWALID